jgi:hypothetical protein
MPFTTRSLPIRLYIWGQAIFLQRTHRFGRKNSQGENMAHSKISIALVSSALWILGLVLVGPASAHHSVQAEFDVHKTITITGTVAKVEFINPHSYLTVDVTDANGTVQHWAFEMGGIGTFRRAGMTKADRDDFKPGLPITITGLAAKDGSNTGHLSEMKFGDGRVFKFGADPNGN